MRYNTRDRCREKGKEDWRRRSEMGKEKEKGGRRREKVVGKRSRKRSEAHFRQ